MSFNRSLIVALAVTALGSFSHAEAGGDVRGFVDRSGRRLPVTSSIEESKASASRVLDEVAKDTGKAFQALPEAQRFELLDRAIRDGKFGRDELYALWGSLAALRGLTDKNEDDAAKKTDNERTLAASKALMKLISEELDLPDSYWNYNEEQGEFVTETGKLFRVNMDSEAREKEAEAASEAYFRKNGIDPEANRTKIESWELLVKMIREDKTLSPSVLFDIYGKMILLQAIADDRAKPEFQKGSREVMKAAAQALELHPVFWELNIVSER